MKNERKESIAAEVLRKIAPNKEATNSVRALQKELHRQCNTSSAVNLATQLIAQLTPLVHQLVQAGTVTGVEATEFSIEVIGELVGTSMGQRMSES